MPSRAARSVYWSCSETGFTPQRRLFTPQSRHSHRRDVRSHRRRAALTCPTFASRRGTSRRSSSWFKMAPTLYEGTAASPTSAFMEAYRAPAQPGAQPGLAGGLARRQQVRPKPSSTVLALSTRRCSDTGGSPAACWCACTAASRSRTRRSRWRIPPGGAGLRCPAAFRSRRPPAPPHPAQPLLSHTQQQAASHAATRSHRRAPPCRLKSEPHPATPSHTHPQARPCRLHSKPKRPPYLTSALPPHAVGATTWDRRGPPPRHNRP
jgi:hypothetical protein